MKCDRTLVRASEITHAKRGYFIFSGAYPNMRYKYFKSKKKALAYKGRLCT